jgi:hypothetical protein
VTISLGRRLRDGSSGVPGSSAGRVVGTCFTLHRTGFGEPPCRHDAGGLLPHLFTLTAGVSGESSPEAVSFLCHFPSAFAAWDFPSVLPCGVRTFLASRSSRGHPACIPNSSPGAPPATHVKFVVVANQCTGQPSYAGDQDNDPNNNADCPSFTPPAPTQPRANEVHATELPVFSMQSHVGGRKDRVITPY